MDPMTIIGLVSLLGVAFKGMYDFTKSIQEDEYNSKLREQGKDPASLAQKQLQLNEDVSTKNFNLQEQQFEYQKELNQLTMQREDNAFQRQVADLKNAGLSPLMIAGGSPASVLTSAQAPQRDMSGINNAISNMIGAYNDAFSRKLQSRQFALQNKVQTAQAYTQLAELSMQRKKVNLENAILGLDYKYYLNHPERNLGLQQVIVNALERIISKNGSSLSPGLPDIKLPGSSSGIGLFDLGSGSKPVSIPDPVTFGLVNPSSKYGHTLDNENYDNNRKTSTLIKDEIKEKYYKNQIKTAIASDNDYSDLLPKLYKNDDYLKKHISLENWKKAKEDFILYYLKYGQFEGHKKYFE